MILKKEYKITKREEDKIVEYMTPDLLARLVDSFLPNADSLIRKVMNEEMPEGMDILFTFAFSFKKEVLLDHLNKIRKAQ